MLSVEGAVVAGAVQGGLTGGIKGAVVGGVSGIVTHGIGELGLGLGHAEFLAKAAMHGVAQGTLAEVQGGKFGTAFLAASFASVGGSAIGMPSNVEQLIGKTMASAVVGGIASQIAGGKFQNGAATGAFVYLFNHAHSVDRFERGNDIHKVFARAMQMEFGEQNVRIETRFSWFEFRFRTDVILFNEAVFELKSHTFQYAENPSRYNEAFAKVRDHYVPGLNHEYNTDRYYPGDFRDFFRGGTARVLGVGEITGRPVLALEFFADPHRRNSGLVFYRAYDFTRAQ